MRYRLIFLTALAALLGSLVTAFASIQEANEQLRGYVDASQDANLPFFLPRLGVNAELTQYTPDELNRQLDLMQQMHVTWVRQIFYWNDIQPSPNSYDWDKWDRIVQAVSQRPGLRLVAVLFTSPGWARHEQATHSLTAPPHDPATFAAFAGALAKRYGSIIDDYQVWDEPNLDDAWGGMEPRPAEYLALLQASYTAIHGNDANAMVILGGLAPTVETGPQNISDILYLHDLYALGAKPYMDAVADKPYGFELPPTDRTVSGDVLNFSRVVALREEMVRNDDGTKALWASNWGWNSVPAAWNGKPSIWGNVTADQQIQYVEAALDRAAREWPWMAGMVLQHWQPPAAKDDPIWGFSIIGQDGQPGGLWRSLVNRPQPTVAENGLYPATNPYASYSGVWTFGPLGADIGWIQDSHFQFRFGGSAVSLLLRQDNYVAYLYPTVDGQPANATPRDASGNAYLVLTSGSHQPEMNLVPVGKNLAPGEHTLQAVADRGWDRWALAGFGVSSGDLTAPYQNQVNAAWLTSAIAALAVIITALRINWVSLYAPLKPLGQRIGATGELAISVITSLALLAGMLLTWGEGTPNIFRRDVPVQLGLAIITAGLIKLQPGIIVTLAAAVVLFIIVYRRIEIGLTLTIFWAPFFLFPVELYRFAFPMSELTILITGAAWLLRQLGIWGRRRQADYRYTPVISLRECFSKLHPLDYLVIAWVLLGVLSLVWALHRSQAVTELRVMILEPALFYLIFRTSNLERKDILRLVDALLIAGLTVAVIGLWQFFQGEAVITAEEGARRLASVYGSPNNVGLFLGRCIPFVLAFLLIRTDHWRRILAGITLAMMGIAVILSQSVGAIFIGVPSAIVAVLLLVLGRRSRLILVALVVVGIIGFALSLQSARFARVLDFSSGTNFFRIRVWQSAINVIQDHPVTGLGLDQFLYAFRGHYIQPDAWQEPNLSHPHNLILDFWVRLGIGGAVWLLVSQAAFWKRAWSNYHMTRPLGGWYFAIYVGVIGSMVNLLSHGLIDNSVYVQDLCYVFILLLALTASGTNIRAIDEPALS
jgi:O-antigen ligase